MMSPDCNGSVTQSTTYFAPPILRGVGRYGSFATGSSQQEVWPYPLAGRGPNRPSLWGPQLIVSATNAGRTF
jgi:hypothetical protein